MALTRSPGEILSVAPNERCEGVLFCQFRISEIPHSRHPRHGHSEANQPRCDLNRWEGVPMFRPSRQLLLYAEIWERHPQNTTCRGSFSRRHSDQSWPEAIDTTTVRLPAGNLASADPTVSESWALCHSNSIAQYRSIDVWANTPSALVMGATWAQDHGYFCPRFALSRC